MLLPRGLTGTNGIKPLPKPLKLTRSKFPRLLAKFRVQGQGRKERVLTTHSKKSVARNLPNPTSSFLLNYMSPPKGVWPGGWSRSPRLPALGLSQGKTQKNQVRPQKVRLVMWLCFSIVQLHKTWVLVWHEFQSLCGTNSNPHPMEDANLWSTHGGEGIALG